ncbi:MAG: MBL fold metallo-hydrolase [Thermodesulfobacteriota bacterium]
MKIHCWGSRGSVTVSGREYIEYGGDTSCIEVTGSTGELIIIDAGTGIRTLGNELVKKEELRINLLITHAHWDHLSGFPFFAPIYDKKCNINVYGPHPTQESLKKIISNTMSAPYFPIAFEDIKAYMTFPRMNGRDYTIGSILVKTIPLRHPSEGVGYSLSEQGKRFVFLTDNELGQNHSNGLKYNNYVEFARDADLLFHDAEYRRDEYKKTKGWGHSAYLDAVKLGLDAGVKALGLFHHNQERTDSEINSIVDECREVIAENGSKMKCFAVARGYEATL